MSKYEIPLHPFDEGDEKNGLYAIVQNGRSPYIQLVDYSTEKPHDSVRLSRRDVWRFITLGMTWVASDTKIHGEFNDEYGEYNQ